jgi:hypothetical protein
MIILVWIGLALASISGILFLVAWWRARPGSGDAVFAPSGLVQTGAILVGILPQLITPNFEPLQITGSMVSIVLTVVAFIMFRRRLRAIKRA